MVHFTMRVPADTEVTDTRRLEIQRRISRACRTWDDRFHDELATAERELLAHYSEHFPEVYKHDFDARRAHADLVVFERLTDGAIDTRLDANAPDWRFTFFVGGASASLSDVLPILQSLGVAVLDERPYTVANSRGTVCWMYEFRIRYASPGAGGRRAAAPLHGDLRRRLGISRRDGQLQRTRTPRGPGLA